MASLDVVGHCRLRTAAATAGTIFAVDHDVVTQNSLGSRGAKHNKYVKGFRGKTQPGASRANKLCSMDRKSLSHGRRERKAAKTPETGCHVLNGGLLP